MRYINYGPISLTSLENDPLARDTRSHFRDDMEGHAQGLAAACGCYVFALKTPGSRRPMPWYVGKAERSDFSHECLADHKLLIYHSVMRNYSRFDAQIFLYARIGSSGRFSKPTRASHRDVAFLEKLLIGYALDRNGDLSNIRETTLLREMIVPGLLNNPRGNPPAAAQRAKQLMGY